jgi:metaxin
VRCLAWQAHVALRELPRVRARWDVAPAGALGGRLPNLHVAAAAVPETGSGSTKAGSSQLLPPDEISAWLDAQVGALGEYDGYADERAREESKAWVALLEGPVRAALVSPYTIS